MEVGTPIHPLLDFQRDITHRASVRSDRRIALSATLRDVYHDIVIEVLVNADTLVIEGVTADFIKSPTSDCCDAMERLKLLQGVTIGKGLNRILGDALAGGDGCGNLRNLLAGLLPLAVNLQAALDARNEEAMLAQVRERMSGYCAGYPSTPYQTA